jgi:type IV secretion system protein VirB10
MTRNDWTDEPDPGDPPQAGKPPSENAPELKVRADPPKVMRISRKALAIAGGVASAGLAAAMFFALEPIDKADGPGKLYPTGRATPAEGVASLPRDYTGIPKLGPPLPGEFGKPVLRRSQETGEPIPAVPYGYAAPGRPPQGATSPSPEAQARAAARGSALFFASTGSKAAPEQPQPNGPELVSPQPTASVSPPRPQSFVSLGAADQESRKTASTDILQAGTVIPAALVTGIQSDLPGLVVAQVTEPVRDSLTGTRVLIPQGSRLIGTYDSELAAGQTRLLLAWTRLLLPDGRSIALDRMPAADATGQAGLTVHINNHWGSTAKAALVSTLLSIGAQSGASGDESDIARAIRDGASDSISRTGRQVVDRELARKPTIIVEAGAVVRAIAVTDLAIRRSS